MPRKMVFLFEDGVDSTESLVSTRYCSLSKDTVKFCFEKNTEEFCRTEGSCQITMLQEEGVEEENPKLLNQTVQ